MDVLPLAALQVHNASMAGAQQISASRQEGNVQQSRSKSREGGVSGCATCAVTCSCMAAAGEYGRLGIGDRSGSSKLRPVKVKGLEGYKIVQVGWGGMPDA